MPVFHHLFSARFHDTGRDSCGVSHSNAGYFRGLGVAGAAASKGTNTGEVERCSLLMIGEMLCKPVGSQATNFLERSRLLE
jgi:hypothetical protein